MCTKSDESTVDGVIIISVDERPPEHIIQKILGVEKLPTSFVHKGINGYKWKLDTKYYTAAVNLYSIPEKVELCADFCDEIQATLFYFNGKEPSSFQNVLNWMPSLNNISSEVQLLICERCGTDENRKNILNWCVENQFELIEVDPEEDSDEEDDGIFSRSKGFGRVIEALQSHTWANLVMKRNTNQEKHSTKEEKSGAKGDCDASSASSKQTDNSKKMKVDDDELLLEEQWLQKVLEQDDPEGDSFEALFSKFASMKEKASGLNGEERKKYAEKVAVAFWKAMGGEEDEIAGLDDD